jgi:hypothetical protein
MPRKKKTLPKAVGFPGQLAQQTLNLLYWLPPRELLTQCTTTDQQQHWKEVKRSAHVLGLYMKAYFDGTAPPSLENFPRQTARMMTAIAAVYIDFYGMCFWNWDLLGKHLKGLPESPGRVFLEVIEQEHTQMAEIALKPFFRYIPDRHRKLNELEVRLHRREITPDDFQQQSLSLIRGTGTELPSIMLQIYTVCKINTDLNTSKRALDAITQFERSRGELDAAVASRLHKSNRPQAIIWGEGERRTS